MQSVEKLLLGLDESATRLAFDLGHEAHSCWNAEVGLEQHLLQLLERALNRAGARDRGDVGERDVLYFGPQRPGRNVTRAAENPAWH